MKILFYIPAMIGGGAERVTAILCNEFVKLGHTVLVATNPAKGSYPLEEEVEILNIYGGRYKKLPWGLRQLYVWWTARKFVRKEKPDVAVAVMPPFYLLARMATWGTGVPFVASDHTSFLPNDLMRFNFIRHHLYGFADVLTILTQMDYRLLGNKYPNKVVMYNPLTFDVLGEKRRRKKAITAIGRLDVWQVKGFDLLIEVWALIASKHPGWILQIAGTGSDESLERLKKMVIDKCVSDSVHFLGFISDVQRVLQESSIFVLSSRIEGFPMSLMEAMSQGCACVSFNIRGVVSEIISNGKDGIIIPDGDIQSMASSLDNLMDNETLRNELSSKALISIKRFEASSVAKQWISLFDKLRK